MKNTKPKMFNPKEFSPHLFWDVIVEDFDSQKSKIWLITRLVQYGNLEDWKKLLDLYGEEQLKKEVVNIRSLDDISISFLAVYFSLNRKDFRCYTQKPSTNDFWKS